MKCIIHSQPKSVFSLTSIMETILIIIFVLGYAAIAFEHTIKINKTAPALIIAALMWTIWAMLDHGHLLEINTELNHELASTSQILFFLMGAMTIVELIDAHEGFSIITNRIKTTDARKLLWIVSFIAFFLSAILDNLTTAIVMVTLLRKLVHDKEQRLFFAGMVIIAANAGGAWSPIGDVTTTMLWIGGQISSVNIIKMLFLPSLVCVVVPLLAVSMKMKGKVKSDVVDNKKAEATEKIKGSMLMLVIGIAGLLFVPVFKTITHLPPYMGMLFSLAVIWIASEIIHTDKTPEDRRKFSALHALTRIDVPSILFFLGILLAIGVLQGTGVLGSLAVWMDQTIGNKDLIAMTIGLLSAVVDNVPIVAATIKMYSLETYPVDSKLWEFIAYAAGTGGSCLIIGSAAGVAVMGMEKIDFMWYLKKIAWLALLGYIAGALVYMGMYAVMGN